jgi:hypothetical protein
LVLRFHRDALVLTTTGPASTVRRDTPDTPCDTFSVTHAGEVVTTYKYGDFTRVDHLTVVSPEDIDSIDLVDLQGIDVSAAQPIEDDVLAGARAGSTVDVIACQTGGANVLARAHTKSGAIALLPGRILAVTPGALASIEVTGREQPIVGLEGRARGEGTLDAEMNGVHSSTPLVVHGHCVPALEADPDAGADAGGDAGGDADQSMDGSADSDPRPSM